MRYYTEGNKTIVVISHHISTEAYKLLKSLGYIIKFIL